MASVPQDQAQRYRFGPFELDAHSGELRKHGLKLKLSGQPIQVLTQLLEHPGELVTREQLRERLWPIDTFVDFDHSLNSAIKRLRQTLLDDPEQPRYIETIPRRGYRFIGTVEPVNGLPHPPTEIPVPPPPESHASPRNVQPALEVVLPKPISETNTEGKVPRRWTLALVAFAVFVVLAIALTAVLLSPTSVPDKWEIEPISTNPGYQGGARLSPDGQYLAFFWVGPVGGSGHHLYVKAIGSEEPRAIGEPGPGSAAWAPDGSQIAYSIAWKRPTIQTPTIPAIYTVSPFGGTSRKLASEVGIQPYIDWSPDGKHIAFLKRANGNAPARAYLLALATLEQRPVSTEECNQNCPDDENPVFSPEGQSLAIIRNWPDGRFSIDIYPTSGGPKRTLFTVPGYSAGMDWAADGNALVFASSPTFPVDYVYQLRKVDVASGVVTDLGIEGSEPTLSRRGNRLSFAYRRLSTNIWRTELSGANAGQSVPLIQSTRTQEGGTYSPDGKKIAFASSRSGAMEVWVANADGSEPMQLTRLGNLAGSPRWSPDGNFIAFDSIDNKRIQHIYVMNMQTGVTRQVGTGTATAAQPSWSPDGKYLYFATSELAVPAVRTQIFKVPVEGGKAVQLTKDPGGSGPMQPKGSDWVFYQRDLQVWQVRPDGSGEQRVQDIPTLTGLPDWLVTATGVYFIPMGENPPRIKFYDFATKTTRTVVMLQRPRITWEPAIDISPDGRYILYSQTDTLISDMMLVKNFKP